MILIAEEILAAREEIFHRLCHRLSGRYDLSLLDDSRCGRSLKFYLLLTEFLDAADLHSFSAEQIFWSRYYWFRYFAKLRQAAGGYDAGLEQTAFKILEYPYPDCEPDWSITDWVKTAVDHDIAKFDGNHHGSD